jgi:APA family basic amino acid/polyamine antiporter
MGDAPGGLKRVIGFWGGAALVVGLTIGSGIFRKPATIAGLVPEPMAILALWAALGVICLCGALTLAELAAMLPKTGGQYVYLRAAYGDAAAFVFGWITLLVTVPAAIGALATFFAELLFELAGTKAGPPGVVAVAVSAIVVLAAVNLVGTRTGSAVQAALTAIKVTALAAIIGLSFLLGGGETGNFSHAIAGKEVTRVGLAAAVASVIWAYDGWVAVSMVAGEVEAPERLLKRIIVWGMAAICVLYLGANAAYLYRMPLDRMAAEKAGVALSVMGGLVGPAGRTAIAFGIMASVFGALSANLLAKPRVAYALAQDGLTFRWIGRVHPRWGTPHVAILIQAAAAVVLVLFLRDFDALTTYFVVVEWFALLSSVGAVFVLRRTMADVPRPYRTPLYPWVPLLFVSGTVVCLAAIVWGEIKKGNFAPVIGLGIALAGFPVFWAWRRFSGSAPAPAKR